MVRLVHAALLREGGVVMAREFWSGHPLEIEGAILAGADLHPRLWDESSRYPLDWVLRVLDSLESFCLRYGLDHRAFLEERMLGMNGGSLLPPRTCLRFVGDFLGDILRTPDIHLTVLRLLESASPLVASGARLRLLRHEREGERLRALVALEVDAGLPELHETDLCSWAAVALEQIPCRLGAPRFDSVRILADLRDLGSAVAAGHHRGDVPEFDGEAWTLRGNVFAKRTELDGWLSHHGLDAAALGGHAGVMAQTVERDWTCPYRGRQVLHRGALHGAPFGLFEVRWTLDDASPAESALRVLIREALDPHGGTCWSEVETLHAQLLENDQHKLHFVFHASDETISCNGTHLLRGVPAKILQKVLIAHTITGRTLFEHREFRRDPDLKLDPANPNLESRLRILAQRLEERLPAVHLVKAGRGRFQFEATVQVAYDEDGTLIT